MKVRSKCLVLIVMLCMFPINVMADASEEVIIEENTTPEAGIKKESKLPIYFLFSILMGGAVIYFVNQTNGHFNLYIDQVLDNGDGSYTVTWKYDKPTLLIRKINHDNLTMNIVKGTAIILNTLNHNDITSGKNIEAYKMIVKSNVEIEWFDGNKKQTLNKDVITKLASKK